MNIQIPPRILQQVKRLQRSKSKQIYLQKCLDFLHKVNYALPTRNSYYFWSSILTGLPWGTSSSDHIPVYKLPRSKTTPQEYSILQPHQLQKQSSKNQNILYNHYFYYLTLLLFYFKLKKFMFFLPHLYYHFCDLVL